MERKKSVENTKLIQLKLNNEPLNTNEKVRIGILLVLHLVGIVGYNLPTYRALFQLVTPLHLLIITIVLLSEKAVLNQGFALFFALAFLIGYGAEVFGVKSGMLFGYYQYTNVLGIKVLDVPIALGLLWAATAYAANEIANKLINGVVFKVILAASIMVLFDYTLEPFAIHAQLWQWNSVSIPNYNYVSWFMVALVLSIIYQNTVKISFNKVSPYFLLIQVAFFLLYQLVNQIITIDFF
ncbi:MAG: carotenoid biosynthesis protein [Cytophagales bacterium]